MINKELVDYIKKVKKMGHSHDTIKKHLIKHGYDHKTVKEVFMHPEIVKNHGHRLHKPKISLPKFSMPKLNLKPIFLLLVIAIVLFLAYSAVSYFTTPKLCKKVSLAVHEINNEDVLCVFHDNSKIQMIIENNGAGTITGVDLEITGSKTKVWRKIEGLNLVKGDVATGVVEYSEEYGNIKKITLTPLVNSEEEQLICGVKKVSLTNIKNC